MRCCTNVWFILLLLCLGNQGYSQEKVLWASTVLSYSSQYGAEEHSADQVLGVPNALGRTKSNHLAWVPKKEDSSLGEYIEVGFKSTLRVKQIAIAESFAPGAIQRIYLIDADGERHLVFENKNPKNILQPYRLFRHTIPKTSYYVKGLRLELKTKAVAGSNQIDAIAISDSGVPIKSKIETISQEEGSSRPERLGSGINSEYAERLPIISPDGKTLYFARKYHPQNIGDSDQDDIWVSKLNNAGEWGFATNIGSPLNNKTHNFVVSFSPTGDVLYLANDYNSKSKDGLSISSKRGRSWSPPKTMSIADMYNDSEFSSYDVSDDGRVLLMAIKRKDGFGDRDIYVSFRESKNSWSRPQNLGDIINTVGMESGVFLAADGKTLYFSSNGHPGYGDLDMFMSKRLDDSWTNWTKPKNMGEGINGPRNEYNYSISAKGDYAYFASDNPDGMSDIYRVKLPKQLQPDPVILYSGKIIDSKTLKPLKNSEVRISALEGSRNKSKLPSQGDYQIAIPYGEDLEVYAEVDGYYTVSERLALSGEVLEQLDYDIRAGQSADETIDDSTLDELKEKIAQVNQEINQLEAQRQVRKPKVNFAKTSPAKEDAELAALKQKYLESQTGAKRNASPRNSQASSGDRELDDLRAKLGQYNKEESSDGKIKDLPTGATAKEDKALSDMKKKYQQYYEDQTTEDPKSPERVASKEESKTTEEESLDFDFIKEKIREEMLAELLPQVIKDLEYRLKAKVIKKVRSALSAEDKVFASNPQLEYLLDDRLKEAPLLNEYPPINRANIRGLSNDLEKAIRKQIKTATTEELEDKYGPLVEDHIEQEYSYLVKKEIESSLALKLQAEMEKRASFSPVASIDNKTIQPKPLVKEYKEKKIDLIAIPLEEGQTIPLNNIFFDANQSTIKAISETELQRVLKFLKQYSGMVVEIGGHTNGWCSHEYANELSVDRAKKVKEYFVEKGISENRVKFRGYGKTAPIDTNETPQGRKKNQRVELKILSMGMKRS